MKSESASVGAGVCVWTGAVGSSAGGWTISTSRASSSARSSTRSSSSRSCSSANASRAASSIDSCSSASSRNAGTASSSVVLSSSSHPSLRGCRANSWAFAANHYNGLQGRRIPCWTKKIRRAGFAFVHFARLTFRFRVLPSGEASSYSRSVLGARGNLTSRTGPDKTLEKLACALCEVFLKECIRRARPGRAAGARAAHRGPAARPGEAAAEELADAGDVRLGRGAELRLAILGQLRVGDASVGIAGGPLDVADPLEPFEQARDPGRRQQHALGEVDAAQPAALRAREVEQHLVVVQRQPVLGDELRVELTNACRVRTQERDPGLDLGCRTLRYLRAQNLTPQLSLLHC